MQVRNSELLAPSLTALGAVTALITASDPPGGLDSSSKVALYSLGTVASYECCQQVIIQSGFVARLQEYLFICVFVVGGWEGGWVGGWVGV